MSDKCEHVWRTNTQHKFKGWKCKKCGLEEHNVELVLRAKLTHYESVVEAVRENKEAAKNYGGGTQITNCFAHMNMDILTRPDNCKLCRADMGNVLRRALKANGFVNGLLDKQNEALTALEAQDD